ncbi:MAG: AAA family ATPase [Dehalococcoidia bacterium]
MRFEVVLADAFGPFRNASLEFTPGLNVIYGPNEAGKSSWHAAMYLALCGMRRGRGQPTKEEKEAERKYKPWGGDQWRVRCRLALGDGRVVEMRQDFGNRVDCSAIDVNVSRDYSNEIMNDGAPDGSRWLGLDRRTFTATACVRQSDMLAVLDSPGELQDYLQRAAATRGADQTAAKAIQSLEAFQSECVGLDRANSNKPLPKARRHRNQTMDLLERARNDHEAYLTSSLTVQNAQREAATKLRRYQLLTAVMLGRKAQRLYEDVTRIRELQARYPSAPVGTAPSEELSQRVAAALESWMNRPSPKPLEGKTANQLEEDLANLPAEPSGDLAPASQVTNAFDIYRAAAQALETHHLARPAPVAARKHSGFTSFQLRAMADGLEATQGQVEPALLQRHAELTERVGASSASGQTNWVLLAGGALLVLLGLAGALVFLPALMLVVIGCVMAVGSRGKGHEAARLAALEELHTTEIELGHRTEEVRQREAIRQQLDNAGLPDDPLQLREIAEDAMAAENASAAEKIWSESVGNLEESVRNARARLAQELMVRGAPSDGTPHESFEAYRKDCETRAHLSAQAKTRKQLAAQLQDRQALERAHRRDEQSVAEANRRVLEVASLCRLETENSDGAVAQLESWLDNRSALVANEDNSRKEWAQLQNLLGDSSAADIEENYNDAREQAAQKASAFDATELKATFAEGELENQLTNAEADFRAASDRANLELGRLEQIARGLSDVAEAEEVLTAAEIELERVVHLDSILRQTTAFLEKAQDKVHRSLAPVLSEAIKKRLALISSGRYTGVRVDPATLHISVAGDGGHWRDAQLLSRGTAEQIYLLLRLAMAEHLQLTSEVTPLLLDEPTVQSDDQRRQKLLELLQELSLERQIILFTQELGVLAWARENLVGDRNAVVELDPSGIPA